MRHYRNTLTNLFFLDSSVTADDHLTDYRLFGDHEGDFSSIGFDLGFNLNIVEKTHGKNRAYVLPQTLGTQPFARPAGNPMENGAGSSFIVAGDVDAADDQRRLGIGNDLVNELGQNRGKPVLVVC